MQDLLDFDLKELESRLGMPPFKCRQIFDFMHRKLKTKLDDLTTLKKEERERIKEHFYISQLEPCTAQKDHNTQKAAFQLADGQLIETVFMRHEKERNTVCISSQVGCPIGCEFCATGKMGFGRNLTCAEILGQVYFFARKYPVSNIVFMGMGEPFLNYDNVLKAIHMLNIEIGLNIAARKIVVSTIGILAGIDKFTRESKQLRLAWSLTAPYDEQRKALIRFPALPSLVQTIAALKDYQRKTKRRITIEYVALKNINDSAKDARKLSHIASQLDCHINLIPYNASPNLPFERGETEHFYEVLKSAAPDVKVTIRQSFGQDISAACGQLGSKTQRG